MRRIGLTALATLAVAGSLVPATAAPGRTTYVRASGAGSRAYWQHVPARLGRAPVPLIVHLHGCTQTAGEAMKQARMNRLADVAGFITVYPDQTVPVNASYPVADGNGAGCWNWFHPDHQVRGKGEPAAIMKIVNAVRKKYRIDPRRIYVSGISAGADMAVILGATYPDVFAAVGAIAGCAYATCADPAGELTFRAMGPRARVVPMVVLQGTADTLNSLAMGEDLVASWLAAGDRADDGNLNQSVHRTPDRITYGGVENTPRPGSGDACVRSRSWTCPGGAAGFQGSYPWTRSRYFTANDCWILDFTVIHGGTHAYPGGDPSTAFSDPLGPNATEILFDFFSSHPRGACVGEAAHT